MQYPIIVAVNVAGVRFCNLGKGFVRDALPLRLSNKKPFCIASRGLRRPKKAS